MRLALKILFAMLAMFGAVSVGYDQAGYFGMVIMATLTAWCLSVLWRTKL